MINKILIFFLLVSITLSSCSTSKSIAVIEDEVYESVLLDTLEVDDIIAPVSDELSNELDIYHASATRTIDLIHTKLEVSFDWNKQYLYGKAYLTLKPYFKSLDIIKLDAKGFDIIAIKNLDSNKKLNYQYDGMKLSISLDKIYSRSEKVNLYIEYIAKPNEAPIGGSAAITSDKGLFFINPLGTDPDKPQQIWTQGETEASSKWFPTVDKPNERCTQEIYITVQDRFKTLSNGLLISSVKNNKDTRTDYWKMDQAHAPYLFMMAIGEFVKIDDSWKGIPLEYYVEPAYEASAKKIFNHTPEMLSFFSKITGVKYPWSKYSQVVVRDYVSGAMENTTAVIFGEFVQKTAKELEDNNNDMIVAHEMFHHWFGDYVTCESWSNLTLNEGFANYSEYLWMEEKYGRKAADKHKAEELAVYLMTMRDGGHDLIDYGYNKKEDMFDAHSYNKGGLILHMLRDYVGDEAFFASLNKYLQDNAYSAVEAHELRLAFEDTTGEDLNWFFDQWFFSSGHPVLEISNEYNSNNNSYILDIDQVQNSELTLPIFRLPIKLSFIYVDNTVEEKKVWLDQRSQTFSFPDLKKDLITVTIDNNDVLLMEKQEFKTDIEMYYEYRNINTYATKLNALVNIENAKYIEELITLGIEDKDEAIRLIALDRYFVLNNRDNSRIEAMIINDKSNKVRANALNVLQERNPISASKLAERILTEEQSYLVILSALDILGDSNPSLVLSKAELLQNEQASSIKTKIAEIFSKYGNVQHLPFFQKNINKASKFGVFPLFNYLQKLLLTLDDSNIMNIKPYLVQQARNTNASHIRRFLSTKTLSIIKEELIKRNQLKDKEIRKNAIQVLSDEINAIKSWETNEKINMMYEGIN